MKKQDFILIGFILAAAIVIFAALHLSAGNGAAVQVEVNGRVVQTLPLKEDAEYLVRTEQGTNLLVVKNGTAQVKEADCRDKICVHHPRIQKNGESIICLPHKVVITVINAESVEEIDAGV